MEPFSILELTLPCRCGHLEGRLHYAEEAPAGPILVVCPPHPLLAGNMDNNVVQAMARHLAPRLPVLLFNYRAVGRSSSPRPDLPLFEYWQKLDHDKNYDPIIRETRDVLAWARRLFTGLHLAGYSFGAHIALQAAADTPLLSYTGIAPPLNHHPFDSLGALNCPRNLIMAERDDLAQTGTIPPKLSSACRILTIRDSDHFFIGREEVVAADLKTVLGY